MLSTPEHAFASEVRQRQRNFSERRRRCHLPAAALHQPPSRAAPAWPAPAPPAPLSRCPSCEGRAGGQRRRRHQSRLPRRWVRGRCAWTLTRTAHGRWGSGCQSCCHAVCCHRRWTLAHRAGWTRRGHRTHGGLRHRTTGTHGRRGYAAAGASNKLALGGNRKGDGDQGRTEA